MTVVVAELSFRFVETPIRRGRVGTWWRRLQRSRDAGRRRLFATAGATFVAVSVFAGVNLATAELEPNELEQTLAEGSRSVTDVLGDAAGESPITAAAPTTTTTSTTTTSTTTTSTTTTTTTTIAGVAGPPSVVPAPTGVSAAPTTAAGNARPTASVPATVAPRRDRPPRTTTTVSPHRIPRLAIGDSVMLGAAGDLAALGFTVDAKVSRQMVDTVETDALAAGRGRAGRRGASSTSAPTDRSGTTPSAGSSTSWSTCREWSC